MFVALMKNPAQLRLHLKHVKVVARNLVHPPLFCGCTGAEGEHVQPISKQVTKTLVARPVIYVVGIGLRPVALGLLHHLKEAVCSSDIEWAEKKSVENTKHNHVGRDAQGQRQDSGERKAGRATQLAHSVAKVARKTFHMENSIGGRYPLAGQGEVAEAEQRVAAGLLGRHAGGDVFFDPHLGVRSKFGFNFPSQFMAAEKICYASKHCHGSSL